MRSKQEYVDMTANVESEALNLLLQMQCLKRDFQKTYFAKKKEYIKHKEMVDKLNRVVAELKE